MFNPIERRSEGPWTALLSLFAVHDRLIRCKVSRWIDGDVIAALESLSLRPVYGAHVMATTARRSAPDGGVDISGSLDRRWLSVNRDVPESAVNPYGAEGTTLVAARIGDVAVGLAVVAGEWAGVAAMYTDPEHRRQGLGSRILDRLIDESADRGANRCFLQVVESNRTAVELYETAGFEVVTAYDYWE